jgi:hypothetical protein
MPKIPVYEQQVKVNPVMPQSIRPLAPVEGAYGENISRAGEKIGAAVSGIGEKLAAYGIQMQERNDEAETQNLTQKFTEEHQNLLWSKDLDKNKNPSGIMYRKLSNAQGTFEEYEAKVKGLEQKYLEIAPERVKAKLGVLMENQRLTFRDEVSKHEASQLDDAYNQTIDSNTKTQVLAAAGISDPNALISRMETTAGSLANALRKGGKDEKTITFGVQAVTSEMIKNSVNAILEKSPQQARTILEATKKFIAPTEAAKLDETIKGKEIWDEQNGVWGQVKNYRLPDGTSDLGKMNTFVDQMSIPTERKEKFKSYIQAQAGEQNQIKKARDNAVDYSFMNTIYDGKKKGVTLSQALPQAQKFGQGAWDVGQKEEIIKKLYAQAEGKTDPVTYMALWTAVRNGQAGAPEMYQAYTKGRVTGSDFMELSKLAYKGEGNLKQTWDRIEIDAKEIYKEPVDRAKYLYTVKELEKENPGISGEELYKKAIDLREKDPSTKWFFGLFGGKENYQVELAKRDAKNAAWGTLENDFGRDTVQAIGQASQRSKGSFGIEDVNTYINDFGADSLKPGGKVNQAIKELKASGLPATTANIKKYLETYATKTGSK